MTRGEGGNKEQHLHRRQCIRRFIGVAFGVVFLNGRATQMATADVETGYWKREYGPYCQDGEVREYWCYYTCYGSVCERLYCETRITGSC